MRKMIVTMLAIIMIMSVIALPVSANDTSGDTVAKMDLKRYMNYLPGYFFDVYKAGDEIKWKGVLGIFEIYCHSNADSLDFVTLEDPDGKNMVYLEGEGFREFAKVILGERFDPDIFLEDEHTSIKYDADTDVYSYGMSKDYWGENPYHNSRTLEITEGDAYTTATVEITTGSELYGIPEGFIGIFEYKFKHVVYNDTLYYQLDGIKMVDDTAPQTGVTTAAYVILGIVALVSGAYIVIKERRG